MNPKEFNIAPCSAQFFFFIFFFLNPSSPFHEINSFKIGVIIYASSLELCKHSVTLATCLSVFSGVNMAASGSLISTNFFTVGSYEEKNRTPMTMANPTVTKW